MKEHDFDTMDDCPNWYDGCHCREASESTETSGDDKDKLEQQVWEIYTKTRNISQEELADEELCKRLQGTFDYALCRNYVAWCNLVDAILDSLPIEVKRFLRQ